MGNVSISYSELATTYCFDGSFNRLLKAFSDKLVFTYNGESSLVFVGTVPPNDTSSLWYRIDATGFPDDIYHWNAGISKWISEYKTASAPTTVSEGMGMIWMGAESEIIKIGDPENTESDPDNCTLYTGPFWVKDERFNARSPMGVGTLALAIWSVDVDINSEGGLHTTTLVDENIPSHRHSIPNRVGENSIESDAYDYSHPLIWNTLWGTGKNGDRQDYLDAVSDTAETKDFPYVLPSTSDQFNTSYTGTAAATSPANTTSPNIGTFILERTIRKYKTYS